MAPKDAPNTRDDAGCVIEERHSRVKALLGMARLLQPFLDDLGADVERIAPILEMILLAHGFPTDEVAWKLERLAARGMQRVRATSAKRGKRPALGWVSALGGPAVAAREIIVAVIPRRLGCGAKALHAAVSTFSDMQVEAARRVRTLRYARLEMLQPLVGSRAYAEVRGGVSVRFSSRKAYLADVEARSRRRARTAEPSADPRAELGHLFDLLLPPALLRFALEHPPA